jgi:hypothetical protein
LKENPEELQDGDNAEADEESTISTHSRDEVHPGFNFINILRLKLKITTLTYFVGCRNAI